MSIAEMLVELGLERRWRVLLACRLLILFKQSSSLLPSWFLLFPNVQIIKFVFIFIDFDFSILLCSVTLTDRRLFHCQSMAISSNFLFRCFSNILRNLWFMFQFAGWDFKLIVSQIAPIRCQCVFLFGIFPSSPCSITC